MVTNDVDQTQKSACAYISKLSHGSGSSLNGQDGDNWNIKLCFLKYLVLENIISSKGLEYVYYYFQKAEASTYLKKKIYIYI